MLLYTEILPKQHLKQGIRGKSLPWEVSPGGSGQELSVS